MGASVIPAAGSLAKRNIVRLTSGTSWTVPAGVTNIVATLIGGGGGGQSSQGSTANTTTHDGLGGQIVTSSLATTPGASITYAIGAAGTGGTYPGAGGAGGTTTFTGATSALGGNGGTYFGAGIAGQQGNISANQGTGGINGGSTTNGGAGGAGSIEIEYWSN